jgi:predicted RNA-binding protein with PUA-like domain
MPKTKQYWLVKQEPTSYSWDQFVADGKAAWTGVRSYPARLNLRAMRTGDEVLYYHSVVGKEVVGIAKVTREAYPDPTADEEGWVSVDLAPGKKLKNPVPLDVIKATPALKNIGLLRQTRLSVMPLTEVEFRTIVELAKTGG